MNILDFLVPSSVALQYDARDSKDVIKQTAYGSAFERRFQCGDPTYRSGACSEARAGNGDFVGASHLSKHGFP